MICKCGHQWHDHWFAAHSPLNQPAGSNRCKQCECTNFINETKTIPS
jgi:hypothetical protein